MPESTTRRAAERDKRRGLSANTQAGEYVHEEIDHVREGRHGVKNVEQAIAIGLSKARRDGVKVKPAKNAPERVKKKAVQDSAHAGKSPSKTRSHSAKKALKRASSKTAASSTVGTRALSGHAKATASKRGARLRSAAGKKAAHTRQQHQSA